MTSADPGGATQRCDVVVVGAGMAGVCAARELVREGAEVVVVDKGVSAGGRVATRRIGGASLDHGAQFFTVRSDEFARLVDDLRAGGCPVRVWAHGLAQARHVDDGPTSADAAGDGHPRFCVDGGMNRLVRDAARGLDVRTTATVTRVEPAGDGWRVTTADGLRLAAPAVVVTPPVPQSLALVAAGGSWLDAPHREQLEAVVYDPCIAVLLTLDAAAAVPAPGGVQLSDGPVRFLGDNAAKGASTSPAVTVHLAPVESWERWDADDAAIFEEVGGWLRPWLGSAAIQVAQVKRWRFAQPAARHPQRALATEVDGRVAVFAGDAFAEAKVEGAARSGLAAARRVAAG